MSGETILSTYMRACAHTHPHTCMYAHLHACTHTKAPAHMSLLTLESSIYTQLKTGSKQRLEVDEDSSTEWKQILMTNKASTPLSLLQDCVWGPGRGSQLQTTEEITDHVLQLRLGQGTKNPAATNIRECLWKSRNHHSSLPVDFKKKEGMFPKGVRRSSFFHPLNLLQLYCANSAWINCKNCLVS